MEPVEFVSEIAKLQNLQTTGGYRLSLDIPSTHRVEAAQLLMAADATGMIARVRIEFEQAETHGAKDEADPPTPREDLPIDRSW